MRVTCACSLQTVEGKKPKGYCAEEFQEYMRQAATRKMQAVAEEQFKKGPQCEDYEQLKRDLDWNDDLWGPCYLLAMDQDRRHSFVDYRNYRAEKEATGKAKNETDVISNMGRGITLCFKSAN